MNNQFSENLKRIRKEHNLSQEQLADELGVSRQAISKWESSTAFPEMDKIIALCDKFDVNIDDLLHKNIKEIKGEEESKNRLNKSIEDFLKFITDTINLFSNMSLKSKLKCLIEQAIIVGILLLISYLIVSIGHSIFYDLLYFLPTKIKIFINTCLTYFLALFCFLSLIIIVVHVFKTRYLDYYEKLKENINIENINRESKDIVKQEDNKILFKKNENKIIIRDPKNSDYKFISSLFKFIVGIVKFFALMFAFSICLILLLLCISFTISLLFYKTGIFFLGLIITILSLSVITIIVLLIIFNFIFNRKNDKKRMIWSFIISLITFGLGIGLILIGTLNFKMVNDDAMLKTITISYDMNENMFMSFDSNDVQYVEANIDNIKIDYKLNKYFEVSKNNEVIDSGIYIWSYCSDPLQLIKDFISNVNNKEIVSINDGIKSVVIYGSKENLDKLKANEINYFNSISNQTNIINRLEEKIRNYAIKFEEYENKITNLKAKLEEYEEIISSYENQ